MPDYKKAIIYKITTGNNFYIGSTCNFTKRKYDHKFNIYNQNDKRYNFKLYKTIRKNDGKWDMKPYKEFPCENKTQLVIEEERIRSDLNADLNSQSCGTGLSKKEYSKNYSKQYNFKQYQKEYRFQNKDKLSEQGKQKTTCECGCVVSKKHISRHKKSKKHIELIKL